MSYDGPERRKDNIELETRVRDLEEKDRSGVKSREMMHIQLDHLNTKMDLMLSRQDEKNDECAVHKTDTALLKQHQTLIDERMEAHEDDVKWAFRTALGGALGAVCSLVAAIWSVKH
jgi:hypothetical protein